MSQLPSEDSMNADWLKRYRASLPNASLRTYDPKHSLVIQHGRGSRVWDVEGNEYIDLTCGYSTSNLGHANEALLQAASSQLSSVTHLTGQPHVGQVQLAERLVARLRKLDQDHQFPVIDRKVVFNSSGARAIESAWRAAAEHRPGNLLSISPAFHGNTIALTRHSAVEPREADPFRRPAKEYPQCARCPLGLTYPECSLRCAEDTFEFIQREASSISAILIEPMLGARGYIVPPKEYFRRICELAAKHGIVTIADEVQTALGRCGNWTLSHLQGWQADLLVIGKSLGGGIAAISAVIGRGEILDCLPPGDASETFAAPPIATTVALAVLDQIEELDCSRTANHLGQQLRTFVSNGFQGVKFLGGKKVAIDGLGASCCIEFLSETDPSSANDARRFALNCQAAGLLVHLSGPLRTRVVLIPPLNITPAELSDVRSRIEIACRQQR